MMLQEISVLKDLYPTIRVNRIVNRFPKRNGATIVAKARSLGLLSAKLWKDSENKILKIHFHSASSYSLLRLLPGRTSTAILAQGERLGLKRKRNKPRLPINEGYFKTWSANSAYHLGFILSDGCIV